ncbi:uncharacterized protein AMSG_02103 [Thecamonas trahens ATCC 50062]|uniref:Neutral/alkaline non-lysosomal ceramidase N-terminal domain-containing protein n=1 Tax=Thecamonas trahens ATCC 50062 TaxID=461836 RepID=A0A0L0DV55_THETB|nr:hypothetical protein AMSG_02103 [Thecamonas trahens ATCC 50062]KNC56090.1 hypothetical protein AMSG_02103 [Thecamonas trahens ATCC 50062]|eukprot:XP_013761132.1 hypothetical protein AMSG_02103 [Thecamonas trahens ATCC 50062]
MRLALVALSLAMAGLLAAAFAAHTPKPTLAAIGTLMAGAAKKDVSLPIGIPLAGYNHGDRRVPKWPLPQKRKYTTFMMPSVGIIDPTWCKVLILDDGKGTQLAFVTLDGIGSDETLNGIVIEKIREAGSTLTIENIVFASSHTHSGPGAISPRMLWALAPATDLLVYELQQELATNIAATIMEAHAAMEPAVMDIGIEMVYNLTVNRCAKDVPWLARDHIDPNMGVIAVNKADGSVMATVWNFAFHSVCYGPSNMKLSSDLAGAGCRAIEAAVGGVALFVNADAGDVDPAPGMCNGGSESESNFVGGKLMADRVVARRAALSPTADVTITTAFVQNPLGKTDMNLTLARMANCTRGGPLDICSFCEILDCDANLHLDEEWLDENPWYVAARFDIGDKHIGAVTIPGELLTTPGDALRADMKAMGYTDAMIWGYSEAHGGYFPSSRTYDHINGLYENQLAFWGPDTADKVVSPARTLLEQIKPSS